MQLLTYNPYSYNSVSLKAIRERNAKYVPTAEAMVTNPVYNAIFKFLGIHTKAEINLHHQKVLRIVDWAMKQTNSDDLNKLKDIITGKINQIPELNSNRIDDLDVAIRLESLNNQGSEYSVQQETKPVVNEQDIPKKVELPKEENTEKEVE